MGKLKDKMSIFLKRIEETPDIDLDHEIFLLKELFTLAVLDKYPDDFLKDVSINLVNLEKMKFGQMTIVDGQWKEI